MTHEAPSMSGVKDPPQRLSKVIQGTNDSRNVEHFDVSAFLPLLNGKVLDANMSRSFCWYSVVDHIDSRDVITIDRSRLSNRIPQFLQDRP